MGDVKIAPSILAADPLKLGEALKNVKGADMLHLDIMDGHFVPNISMGPAFVEACKRGSDLICETHLMVEKPERLLSGFIAAGSDIITLHVESTPHIYRGIQELKENNVGVGVSLNPGTPLSVLDSIWEEIDLLLLMTVNPGFGGQAFIPGMLEKIKEARYLIDSREKEIDLAVDGGVNAENVGEIVSAGARVIVAGSAIFGDNNGADWDLFRRKTLA